MNTRLKWIFLFACTAALPLPASADHARDCKQMQVAQAQMQKSVKLLTDPNSSGQPVDIRSEYAALNIAGIKLRVLAANARCEMSLAKVTPENVTVHYQSPLSIAREDQFELSERREVLAWRHLNKKGRSATYKFGPSGEVVFSLFDGENL